MQPRNAEMPDFVHVVNGLDEVDRLEMHLTALGYAPGTVEQRIRAFRRLPVSPSQATRDDVMAVLHAGLSADTRRIYLSALRSGYRELLNLGLCSHDPTVGIRLPGRSRRTPRPLAPDACDRLLAVPGIERTWTVLGMYAGLRAAEAAGLYIEDLVSTQSGRALHVEGKGGVRATIPAHPLVVQAVESTGRLRGPVYRITPGALSSRWGAWASGILGTRVTFHQCRHTYGTRLYKLTNDILVVRDLMRHASVATTQSYTQVDDERGYSAVAGL